MAAVATITSLVPRAVLRAAALEGLDVVPLYAVAGLEARSEPVSDQHIDIERYYELWDRLMSASGDPSLPVRAALASDIGRERGVRLPSHELPDAG